MKKPNILVEDGLFAPLPGRGLRKQFPASKAAAIFGALRSFRSGLVFGSRLKPFPVLRSYASPILAAVVGICLFHGNVTRGANLFDITGVADPSVIPENGSQTMMTWWISYNAPLGTIFYDQSSFGFVYQLLSGDPSDVVYGPMGSVSFAGGEQVDGNVYMLGPVGSSFNTLTVTATFGTAGPDRGKDSGTESVYPTFSYGGLESYGSLISPIVYSPGLSGGALVKVYDVPESANGMLLLGGLAGLAAFRKFCARRPLGG